MSPPVSPRPCWAPGFTCARAGTASAAMAARATAPVIRAVWTIGPVFLVGPDASLTREPAAGSNPGMAGAAATVLSRTHAKVTAFAYKARHAAFSIRRRRRALRGPAGVRAGPGRAA